MSTVIFDSAIFTQHPRQFVFISHLSAFLMQLARADFTTRCLVGGKTHQPAAVAPAQNYSRPVGRGYGLGGIGAVISR